MILVLYVDDGLLAADDKDDLDVFIKELQSEFKIVSKDADYFLGIEKKRQDGKIKIDQKSYTERILQRLNFSQIRVNTYVERNRWS